MKIKKGDTIKVITGNDRGKKGVVAAVLPQAETIVVEGLNLKKKHVRPRQQGKKGELVRMPAPFSVSRVLLICPKCSAATRVGRREGSRVCKKCNATI